MRVFLKSVRVININMSNGIIIINMNNRITWCMMAVRTDTVTLSLVLVLVVTLSCCVFIETAATVCMGQSTKLQPGSIVFEYLPQSCHAHA